MFYIDYNPSRDSGIWQGQNSFWDLIFFKFKKILFDVLHRLQPLQRLRQGQTGSKHDFYMTPKGENNPL